MKRRIHSFVWGGLVGLVFIAIGISSLATESDSSALIGGIILGISSFTLISCLILNNNFVSEMVPEVFSWGFVRMPGLIFTLDLDGILWLLTVKLLFWVLGIFLALICGTLAIILGLIVSVFVYPFAIYNNMKQTKGNVTEE